MYTQKNNTHLKGSNKFLRNDIFLAEWRHGRGGHLILADEDLTTKIVNGWKRINTLAHYGIRESAVMCLVARRKEMLNSLRMC